MKNIYQLPSPLHLPDAPQGLATRYADRMKFRLSIHYCPFISFHLHMAKEYSSYMVILSIIVLALENLLVYG